MYNVMFDKYCMCIHNYINMVIYTYMKNKMRAIIYFRKIAIHLFLLHTQNS